MTQRVEPVRDQDKVMMGMFVSLGIEKGKPFTSDGTAKRAMPGWRRTLAKMEAAGNLAAAA